MRETQAYESVSTFIISSDLRSLNCLSIIFIFAT